MSSECAWATAVRGWKEGSKGCAPASGAAMNGGEQNEIGMEMAAAVEGFREGFRRGSREDG